MKKRVLYYAPQRNDTTSFWRICGVLPYATHPDYELVDVSHLTEFSWTTFQGASVFIMQRPFVAAHLEVMSLVKDMGVKIIVDYDDLLTDVPMFNPTHPMYNDGVQNTRKCILLADEVWVSTQVIKDEYSHPNCHIIKNAHNDYFQPIAQKKAFKLNTDDKKAIWRGGGSHSADVYSQAEEIIKIVSSHKDWNFISIGEIYTYIAMRCGDNYQMVSGMTIINFFKYLNFENPQAMYFPLEDNKFNRAKSNICFLEATYAGAAFFGSKELPEFNIDSVLPFSLMNEAINELTRLEKMNRESWELITDTLLLSKINQLRIERILANVL